MQDNSPQPAAEAASMAVVPDTTRSAKTFIRLLRPRQWVKNLIAYAPALFGSQLFHRDVFIEATICVASFCLASSAVYILNDILDRESDRLHPTKRNRPIASGAVPLPMAAGLSALLSIGAIGLSAAAGWPLTLVILGYMLMMVAYCKWLKHVVLLDVFIIAAGFVLRALGGGIACHIELSPWFLLCTIFGALFLGIEKRSHETRLLAEDAGAHRKSLTLYTPQLLDKLQSVVTSSLIISYALYTFHSPHGQIMLVTVPIVLYAVMRYQLLAVNGQLTGTPEEALLRDTPLKASVVLWAVTCALIVYRKTLLSMPWFN